MVDNVANQCLDSSGILKDREEILKDNALCKDIKVSSRIQDTSGMGKLPSWGSHCGYRGGS